MQTPQQSSLLSRMLRLAAHFTGTVPRWLRDGSEPWRSRQKAQAGLLLRISLVQTPQQSSLLSRMLRQAAHFTGTVPRWLRVGSEPWRSRQKAQAGLLLRISLVQTPQQSSLLRQMLRQAARFTGMAPSWPRDGSEPWRSRQKAQAGLLLRISRANAAAIQSAEPDASTIPFRWWPVLRKRP